MPLYTDISLAVVHRMYEYLIGVSKDVICKPSEGITRYFILILYDFMVLRAGFKVHEDDNPTKICDTLRSSLSEVKKLAYESDYSFLLNLMGIANSIRHEFSESDYIEDFKELLENENNEGIFDRLYEVGVLGFDNRLYKFLISKEFNAVINKDIEGYSVGVLKFIKGRVLSLLSIGTPIKEVVEECKRVGWNINTVNSVIVEYMCSKEVG